MPSHFGIEILQRMQNSFSYCVRCRNGKLYNIKIASNTMRVKGRLLSYGTLTVTLIAK